MSAALEHRGPDDHGAWAGEGVGIGARRLSIIDLAGGRQPMWTDDGVGLVYNGEVYNYRELRDELRREGSRFRTESDTEVVLELYARHGLAGVERLEGIFGFAVYDGRQEQLHLVRDRLGVKPLYFGLDRGRFLFASELKAVLAGMAARPRLDQQALHHYLTLRYVPSPGTIWADVWKLEPGHHLSYDLRAGTWKTQRWWHVDFASAHVEPDRAYVDEFEQLFLGAVERQLVAADVPVGVMLSGGLDSSAVTAAAVELGHRAFHTFSVGFAEGGDYSELEHARAVAEHVGSRHHEVVIGAREFVDFLPELVSSTDEPLADLAAVPLHYVSRLAHDHVKVVLSGEGSDEILAGYDMERLAAVLAVLGTVDRVLPTRALRALARWAPAGGRVFDALARGGWSGYLRAQGSHMTHVFDEDEKRVLWGAGADGHASTDVLIDSWYAACPSPHPLDQLQQVYCSSWLVEDLLMKADKISMATSLELRVPFLDHALVEWAATLPLLWKVGDRRSGWASKRVLRHFAAPRLPHSTIARPKQGFPVPAHGWLAGELGAWAEDRLLDRQGPLATLFEDTRPLAPLATAARAGDRRAAERAWTLLVLDEWLRRWLP